MDGRHGRPNTLLWHSFTSWRRTAGGPPRTARALLMRQKPRPKRAATARATPCERAPPPASGIELECSKRTETKDVGGGRQHSKPEPPRRRRKDVGVSGDVGPLDTTLLFLRAHALRRRTSHFRVGVAGTLLRPLGWWQGHLEPGRRTDGRLCRVPPGVRVCGHRMPLRMDGGAAHSRLAGVLLLLTSASPTIQVRLAVCSRSRVCRTRHGQPHRLPFHLLPSPLWRDPS